MTPVLPRCHLALPVSPGPGSRLLVVLHGTERNAADYRDAWRDFAREHDRVVVCPEFDRIRWPGAAGYVLGGRDRPRSEWVFSLISDVAAATAERFSLADRRFDLWGHSAGAQVVHRFTLFAPDAPLRRAIAANAGWYTLPTSDAFPYGAGDVGGIRRWTRAPLHLMRGNLDVERDATLRVTPRADRQGPDRWTRAATMHAAGHAADPGCTWELHDVPGVGHHFAPMAQAAQRLLVAGDERPFTGGSRSAQTRARTWSLHGGTTAARPQGA